MAFAAIACTDNAGDPGALKKLKVRFASPVKPLDTVVVSGKYVAKEGDILKAEITATTKNGEIQVLTNAQAEFRRV